jgi:hypothetical protein
VQLIIGTDFNGIGQAVTAQAPAPSAEGNGRTAEDASCIY